MNAGGPVALLWLEPREAEYAQREVRMSFESFIRSASQLKLREVLLAEPDVPEDVLDAIGFHREISSNQVTGFWFERGDGIPSQEPSYFPSMAVLPRDTYSHASELVNGRAGFFVPKGPRWRERLFRVKHAGFVDAGRVTDEYGSEVAQRARPGRLVLVSLGDVGPG